MKISDMTVEQFRGLIREEVARAMSELHRHNPSRLLTYRQVEAQFGIKRSRLYDLHKCGVLFYMKDGRKTVWRESDVASYANMLKTG